ILLFTLSLFSFFFSGNWFQNDFRVYQRSIHGDFTGFYYPHYFLPVIYAIDWMPVGVRIILWSALNVFGIWYACRVFGGKWWPALFSFQMLYVLWIGQVAGIVIGSLAFLFTALEKKKVWLAGIALTIASIKPQLGFPLAFAIWLTADITWKKRFTALVIPVAVVFLSIAVSPGWPAQLISSLQTNGPNNWGSVSLWRLIGPASLVLWLPLFIIRLDRSELIFMVAVTSALATPYFQQTDLLLLFSFPIGYVSLLGNYGYIIFWYDWPLMLPMILLPLGLYCWFILKIIFLRYKFMNGYSLKLPFSISNKERKFNK
ncbi:MAG: glycosyltransferase family 87 protein, partial [Anaerolineaceae bacterium]